MQSTYPARLLFFYTMFFQCVKMNIEVIIIEIVCYLALVR